MEPSPPQPSFLPPPNQKNDRGNSSPPHRFPTLKPRPPRRRDPRHIDIAHLDPNFVTFTDHGVHLFGLGPPWRSPNLGVSTRKICWFFNADKNGGLYETGKKPWWVKWKRKKNTLDLMLFWKVIGNNSRLGIVRGPGEKSMSVEGMKKEGGMLLSSLGILVG